MTPTMIPANTPPVEISSPVYPSTSRIEATAKKTKATATPDATISKYPFNRGSNVISPCIHLV
jgi:hypothetical protein